MPSMIGSKEIGGGFVRRAFTDRGERLKVGHQLTAERIKSWPNGHVLEKNGFIATYPPPPNGAAEPAKRHVVQLGFGKYGVIEGRKLHDRPMTKDEAERLASSRD